MTPANRKTLFDLAAKISALEILFGGPILVSDTMRPVIGKWPAALIFAVLPIGLYYMGASNLAGSDDFPPRRGLLRIGILGALMVAPMNVYAIQRLLQDGSKVGSTTVFGVVLCSIVIVTYLALATRELRKPPPVKPPFDPTEDPGPID